MKMKNMTDGMESDILEILESLSNYDKARFLEQMVKDLDDKVLAEEDKAYDCKAEYEAELAKQELDSDPSKDFGGA